VPAQRKFGLERRVQGGCWSDKEGGGWCARFLARSWRRLAAAEGDPTDAKRRIETNFLPETERL